MVVDQTRKNWKHLFGYTTVFLVGLILISLIGSFVFKNAHERNIITSREFSDPNLPIIYAVTPTYYRYTRFADITRLANTLVNVERLHWILIEDGPKIADDIQAFLNQTGIPYTYFPVVRNKNTRKVLKGIDQRNAALAVIRKYHRPSEEGVVYFADDDNSYNLHLFEEMRYTKKLSMWPVGLVGGRAYEAPLCEKGKVVGFDAWESNSREFPVDMAGFAINVKVLFDFPKMVFPLNAKAGFQETEFLRQCCKIEDIEPKSGNCTKIYVWHTKTQKPNLKNGPQLSETLTTKKKKTTVTI